MKTIAIATGSSSGRACSSRKTVAIRSRPRPTQVVALRRAEGSIAIGIGAMARAMMAWPLPCRRDAGESPASRIDRDEPRLNRQRKRGHGDPTSFSAIGIDGEDGSRDAGGRGDKRRPARADRADARQGGRLAAERRRLPVRAEVGRLSRHRLSSARRRRRDPEPRPAPARPLLPRAARRPPRPVARRRDRRRRDRRRRRRRPRLRRPAAAPAPGGVAGRQAGGRDAGVLRRLRSARRRRHEPARRDAGSAPRRAREAARRARSRRST